MIGKLTGTLDSTGDDWAILDVNGVGYLVSASSRTLGRLQAAGAASLLIETQVREESITLFGFFDAEERDWFRLLTSVQGVGGRVALSILSALAPEELLRSIAAEDKRNITRADGVGPKLAARIVNELKEKAGRVALGSAAIAHAATAAAAPAGAGTSAATAADAALRDAVSALVNLGFGRSEAFGAAGAAHRTLGEGAGVGDLVRIALKELSR